MPKLAAVDVLKKGLEKIGIKNRGKTTVSSLMKKFSIIPARVLKQCPAVWQNSHRCRWGSVALSGSEKRYYRK